MIRVYAFPTPNNVRVPIALEELGLPYELQRVNIRAAEQKTPEFLALNPNGKVPVLVDPQGPDGKSLTLTESGAILIYLAEKTGRLLPRDGETRYRIFEQMLFHLTAIGPAFGQAGYFQKLAPEPVPAARIRFETESDRVMKVLDERLSNRIYVAGEEFTIGDVAHFGWMWRRAFADVDLSSYRNVERWYDLVERRPAVQRAIEKLSALAG
ncbi:MAG TPA: glutathione S-transferase family protein [Sphingomicrobium sp.]|nr:glutathione S-transferase family protein [Sphingomicrobium sp.]